MPQQVKKLTGFSLTWKLLLVPVVAAIGFAIYLIYSSMVLSDGNALLKEIRDADFPILYAAEKNLGTQNNIIEALNTAASAGEAEFLDIAREKAEEIRARYEELNRIDTTHKKEIEKLKREFDDYFSQASDVARLMTYKKEVPDTAQLMKMRAARDLYLSDALQFRNDAEKEFHVTVSKAIERSERAQESGAAIGAVMLLVIVTLTILVTRGIMALEKGVADRNIMLAEMNKELEGEIRKLKAAEEARSHAEAASQIKDEFLANMSHELRTPMNAVIGLSHLCMQTEMSRKQHDYLQKIHRSAKSLLGILNDILDISKIEAGKLEMDQTPFDLEEVMSNLATIVSNKSHEKNIEFLQETALNVPSSLIGDPLRLSQVLINLAGNAVKFTDQGEVIVRVEFEGEAEGVVALRFTIEDTGIGMSEKEISRLFQPFTQADSSITRKFGGTGLGLTISKRLVEMMGGNIWVESTLGAGSKFIFTAHFHKAEKQVTHVQQLSKDLRSLRVLAVDDSESSLHILKSYLESFTFEVTLAGSGVDALQAVKRANEEGKPFALVILDWKMPEMDGIELSRRLREMHGMTLQPKILLISAYGQNEMAQQTDRRVVDGMLAKPFQQSKLFDSITQLFRRDESQTGRFKIAGAQFDPELVSRIRGARLLLVEDNEINQQVAQELLESFGVRVVIAGNGEEAISILNEGKFDGVLMDMQMPVMDGVTATREIRKNPKFATLPIIALTANVMVSEQNEFIDAGMNDHIGKPIDPDRMVATLAKWVYPARMGEVTQPPKKTATAASMPLPDLPGINVAESVRRIGGKVAIYYSLLGMFRSKEHDVVTRIREAWQMGDSKTAERLAHTLKGTAGTLGAETLQSQAGILENCFKDKIADDIDGHLEQLERELSLFNASIDRAIEARNSG